MREKNKMAITDWGIVFIVLSLNIAAIAITIKGKFTCGTVIQVLGDTISLIYLCTQIIQYHLVY